MDYTINQTIFVRCQKKHYDISKEFILYIKVYVIKEMVAYMNVWLSNIRLLQSY